MDENTTGMEASAHWAELQSRLLALGSNVESLFADALLALMAEANQSVDDLRAEDYKVHEQCLEIDSLCLELLTDGSPGARQVRFATAAGKMATDLKRAADECLLIGKSLRSCGEEIQQSSSPIDSLVPLAELTRGMLSDGLEALVNGDAAEASALHLVFREVAALHKKALDELAGAVSKQKLSPQCGIALSGVVLRLDRVASEALDLCNQVSHLYREERPAD